MVQMDENVRAIDMRVMAMEFFKAIGMTALLTQKGKMDGSRTSTMDNFKRTCFGLLGHKQKHSKAGYTCIIDFLKIDETTFEGASVMAELIGIQAFMMGGKGACRVIVTNPYGEDLGTAKTFRYNASAINDRGTVIIRI